MTGYLYRLPDGYDPALHCVSEGVTRFIEGGRIYRQMVRVGEVSSKATSALLPLRSVLAVAQVGVAVAAFVNVQRQLKQTHSLLQLVATKLDTRHRDSIFAGLNASLDVMTLADSLPSGEARSFVLSNYASLARDLGLLDSYIAELRAEADTIDKLVMVATIEVMAASLEMKLLFVTDRVQLAVERMDARMARFMPVIVNFHEKTSGRTISECSDEGELKRLLALYSTYLETDELTLLIRIKLNSGITGYWGDKANEKQVSSIANAYKKMVGLKVDTEIASTSPGLFRELCNEGFDTGQYCVVIAETEDEVIDGTIVHRESAMALSH